MLIISCSPKYCMCIVRLSSFYLFHSVLWYVQEAPISTRYFFWLTFKTTSHRLLLWCFVAVTSEIQQLRLQKRYLFFFFGGKWDIIISDLCVHTVLIKADSPWALIVCCIIIVTGEKCVFEVGLVGTVQKSVCSDVLLPVFGSVLVNHILDQKKV